MSFLTCRSIFKTNCNDAVMLTSPLTFDPSMIELFLAIKSKATLVIMPERLKKIPRIFCDVLVRHKVTILQCTPSLFAKFHDGLARKLIEASKLRILAFGGERFPSSEVLRKWMDHKDAPKFFNLYGITEVSVWATCHQITKSDIWFVLPSF